VPSASTSTLSPPAVTVVPGCPADRSGLVDRHGLGHGGDLERRRPEIDCEPPRELRIGDHHPRHRQREPVFALGQLGRRAPHHGVAGDRRVLDRLAIEAQRRRSGHFG
jgi:hypothetical protein